MPGRSLLMKASGASIASPTVVLLLHGNGANGSTTILDSSPIPKTVTVAGNTQISTVIADPFGNTTGVISFDGTPGSLSIASSPDLVPGAGAFTIEFWARHISGAAQFMYSNPDFGIGLWAPNILRVVNSSGVNLVSDVTSFVSGSWTHIAVTRTEGVMRLFKNGNLVASASNSVNYSTPGLTRLGAWLDGDNFRYNGYIDECRSQRAAIYTANFVPPTAPFPDF